MIDYLDSWSATLTLTLELKQLLWRGVTEEASEPLEVAAALNAEDQDDRESGLPTKHNLFKDGFYFQFYDIECQMKSWKECLNVKMLKC